MTPYTTEELLAACARTRDESRDLVERAKALCDTALIGDADLAQWLPAGGDHGMPATTQP